MLGTSVGTVDTPAWWVEIRATARDGAREVAEQYANTLINRLGGRVWTSEGVGHPAVSAAQTRAREPTEMPNDLIFSPGVDLITEKVAVVMQDRPVIGMSAWLSDALTSAKVAGRDVQLVTPKTLAADLAGPVHRCSKARTPSGSSPPTTGSTSTASTASG